MVQRILGPIAPPAPLRFFETNCEAANVKKHARPRMEEDVLERIASQFRALAETSRLRLMNVLFEGERTVGDLAVASGLGMANVSKHLSILFAAGFVTRRKEDVRVLYSVADDGVVALCDLVHDRVRERAESEMRVARR
jgi:DNA-binding transcriptional ArsR family regulator